MAPLSGSIWKIKHTSVKKKEREREEKGGGGAWDWGNKRSSMGE